MAECVLFVEDFNLPDGGAAVLSGWTIASEASNRPSMAINGEPVVLHRISRPDVVAAYPAVNPDLISGFMGFFVPNSVVEDYNVETLFGEQQHRRTIKLSETMRRRALEAEDVRLHHREILRRIIACSKCHASVSIDLIDRRQWQCEKCGEYYDCSRGLDLIPETYLNKADIRFQGAICSHGYDATVQNIIDGVGENGVVLDCGAGWRHQARKNVITTEILRYPSTDIVAVGEHLPFKNNSFDAVLSLHVLEHVKNPFVCASELLRVLKPGGRLLAVTPYVVAVHGFPFHFFNPTPSGLRALFDGALDQEQVDVPASAHPIRALKELLHAYDGQCSSELSREKFRSMRIGDILNSDPAPFLDLTASDAEGLLAGNYRITGTKR